MRSLQRDRECARGADRTGALPSLRAAAQIAAQMAALLGALILLGGDGVALRARPQREPRAPASPAHDPALPRARQAWHAAPVAFVPNLGQWPDATCFVARKGHLSLHAFADSFGVVLAKAGDALPLSAPASAVAPALPHACQLDATAIRFWFEAARTTTRPEGRAPLPTRFHYLLGDDPARWRTDVTGYQRVWYPGLYDGVDLALHCDQGEFEYDLHFAPDADVDAVVVRVEGAIAPLRLDVDGALIVATKLGPLRQPVPRAWTETDCGQEPVACAYEILGPYRFRFRAAADAATPLVIDPQLQFSAYLGGVSWDEVFAVADAGGEAVIAGRTLSLDFPTQNALQSNLLGQSDVFVARLPLTGGALVYSTYLGGRGQDEARALALDAGGAPVLAGATDSLDFPLRNAFQGRNAGNLDGFVAQLTPSGGRLQYSTYFGGGGVDAAVGVALDAGGEAVLVGGTTSTDFPIHTAFQARNAGGFDAFVARLPLAGAPPTHSSYFGGSMDDNASDVALDSNGAAVVAGFTHSPDFPTANAFQPAHGGAWDAFVAQFPRAPGPPSYATYLGGAENDLAYVVAIEPGGVAVAAGLTISPDFPTRNAFQASLAGPGDAFVTRLPLAGGQPLVSTYLGGTSTETVLALALDSRGEAVVAGWTFSTDFPVQHALQANIAGSADAFVTRLSPRGGPPTYSTYLGGSDLDKPYALLVDASRAALVVGLTASTDFPTRNPVQARLAGVCDVFLTRLDLLPVGVFAYGVATPGCAGPLPIGASSSPRVASTFSCTCDHAPANATGLLGLSSGGLATPVVIFGAAVWIDPAAPVFALVLANSTASGAAAVPIAVPPNAGIAGAQLFAQFYWADACAPGRIAASNALRITVQP
jgi:hypothetical protein